jgi:hypothetical protein
MIRRNPASRHAGGTPIRDALGRYVGAQKRAYHLRQAYERAQRAERAGTPGAKKRREQLGKLWVRTERYAFPTPAERFSLSQRSRKRNPGRKRPMAQRQSGYVDCKCRDCFDVAIADDVRKGAFCHKCQDAGCTSTGECQRSDAYGVNENPGRKRTMARRGRKLRGAAKSAFLRRMARGRRRAGLRTNPGRGRKRRRAPARKRTRSTAPRRRSAGGSLTGRMLALLPFGMGGAMARRKRKRKSSSRRRRRNPGALLVNPTRRRKRRRSRRRNALVVNPRRRRRARRRNPGYRRRRRNPGIAGFARQGMRDIVMAAIPATIGGIVIGLMDAKLLGPMGTIGRTVGKIVTAVIVAAVGRKWLGPMGTGVAMGAILGTIGHEVGIRLGGGILATSKKEGIKELVEMAATDAETQAELGALIEGNFGDESTATAVSSYELAITGGSPMPKEYQGAFDDEDDS